MASYHQSTDKRGLFWFRHDLRVHDNAALTQIADNVESLTCLFIIDSSWFENNDYDLKSMGSHRYNFLMQSLVSLDIELQKFGHRLQIFCGSPRQVLTALLDDGDVSAVGLNTHCGLYERHDEQWLVEHYPSVELLRGEGTTLFRQDALPFTLDAMPSVFTPFRKRVEELTDVEPALHRCESLPAMYTVEASLTATCMQLPSQFIGGENAGLDHLCHYFSGKNPACYKQTRNAMDGWQHSTKFSPWLANGSLSVRQVYAEVGLYEARIAENDSTYWIKFELLWREFFHWLARRYTSEWFEFGGLQHQPPSTRHSRDVFLQWCRGETGYEIVDACMRQLNRTGYMSNRGRQLVASCFVHELGQDWRYGAAYFEQQLIDFDVASNWGNWLYLAGVGSDPRGHRQFNLEKQAKRYDPDGNFRAKWLEF